MEKGKQIMETMLNLQKLFYYIKDRRDAGFTYLRQARQTHNHTHTLIAKGNLEQPINHAFGLWEEAEHPERTHACKGTTCKLHTERPKAGIKSKALIAARQQC
ncbi:hypothetical protein GOODEAATRI_014376 [Goodea atripinnis]|uniref:Uncharacterized protein n=1 Tax=Goodea atripinnis TaxID=208336 RepID=A0ABV0N4K6_9TELE